MREINIQGNNNIANSGIIEGHFFAGNVTIDFSELKFFNIIKTLVMSEKDQSILNMTEAQKKLASAIEKFAEAELLRSEADKNNSLANLNYSKVMLEDREIIRLMIEKLK